MAADGLGRLCFLSHAQQQAAISIGAASANPKDLIWRSQESGHDSRVKLCAGGLFDDVKGNPRRLGLLIGALRGDGIKSISHGGDAAEEGDVLANKTLR